VAETIARDTAWVRAMPGVFVLIWSTGFIAARYGMPHAPPLTFLALRYALSVAVFALWIVATRPAWPANRAQWWHLGLTGVFMHAGYLGGVWVAVKGGLGAGLVALIVGLQPVLTALWAQAQSRTNSKVNAIGARQWLGLILGFGGLVLVVAHKLKLGEAQWHNVAWAVLALASITAGALYQKRWVEPCDVRTANVVQLLAALLVTAPLALLETQAMRWHPELIGALAWSVLGLTLGGSSLLYVLLQRGAATSVTSLMYLVPPCTALMAAALFGESLTAAVLLGLVLAAVGVALVLRAPAPAVVQRGKS
jgi:drug/metabolite transporter (DMT)-like permease